MRICTFGNGSHRSSECLSGSLCGRKRLTVAAVVALLLIGPLALTGDGEVFVLNALGLGIAALIVRRLARFGRGRRHGDR